MGTGYWMLDARYWMLDIEQLISKEIISIKFCCLKPPTSIREAPALIILTLSPFYLLNCSVSIPSAFRSFRSACVRVCLWLIFSSSNPLNFSVSIPFTFNFELSALSLSSSQFLFTSFWIPHSNPSPYPIPNIE